MEFCVKLTERVSSLDHRVDQQGHTCELITLKYNLGKHYNVLQFLYCRVPARRGLQRTARAATRHRARDPLVRPQVDQTYRGESNLQS